MDMVFNNMLKTAPIVTTLRNGGVGVVPTDTIYGIVGSALNPKTVARIYKLRRRNPKKPMIILIGSMGDLRRFGIRPSSATARRLRQFWFSKKTGSVSVVLPIRFRIHASRFKYLHRGTNTLAFRLPKSARLRKLLQKTRPLVAPSANWEGEPPAKTIREAKRYFKNNVDFYVEAGRLDSPPSMLAKIEREKVVVLRKGAESM